MSENFENPPVMGTANAWQVFLPVVSNAASLAGSACNYTTLSASVVSSAWLLSTASGTSSQPLLGSAYPYQQINTGMLSGVSGQNQTFTSAASYPSAIQWDITGSAQKKSSTLGGFTMTVTDQDTIVSSMAVAAQYHNTSHTTSTVPLSMYPTLTGTRVKRTPGQGPHHSQSLLLPYQEGSQVYYYNRGNLRHLLSQELGHFLQSYDSMSYTGGTGSALQTYNSTPEMVMVQMEVQHTDNLPLASTSGICNSTPVQPITQLKSQVMDSLGMQTSIELPPASQAFCQTQNSEFPELSRDKIEICESNSPPELEDSSLIAPVQSNLALSPAPMQESPENNNLNEIKMEDSESLHSHPNPIANKDHLLCPVESPNLNKLLSCFDPLDQEQQVACVNKGLGKSLKCYEDDRALSSEADSKSSLADITTMGDIDIDCPSLFESLQDLDQPNSLQEIDTKENITNKVYQNSSATRNPCEPPRKNKNKASKLIEGEPQNKIQRKNQDDLLGEEVRVSNSMARASDRFLTMSTHHSQQHRVTSNNRKAKSQGQSKTKKVRESKPNKVDETRQTGTKGEAEGKTAMAQTTLKRNATERRPEPFTKPRSSLGLHMLESVQVFHALGKKREPTPGLSSSNVLGNSNKPKGLKPSSLHKPRPPAAQEKKAFEKPQIQSQKPSSSAEGNGSSPSIYELPPPGKIKSIPLPFPPLEKPRRVSRRTRPQTLAASVPAASQPAWPGSSTATQPNAGKLSLPNPASLADSARPAQSISAKALHAAWINPSSQPIPPSETSRPAPVKATSGTSLQRDPRIDPVTKCQSPPKSQNQCLLQDFSAQRIPWREPTVPGPVMSTPITKEQRPEHEAMKRRAQQEREMAAQYTSMGNLQFFPQRERDIDLSLYYGYVKY